MLCFPFYILSIDTDPIMYNLNQEKNFSFQFKSAHQEKIIELLLKIMNNKATGPDKIPEFRNALQLGIYQVQISCGVPQGSILRPFLLLIY